MNTALAQFFVARDHANATATFPHGGHALTSSKTREPSTGLDEVKAALGRKDQATQPNAAGAGACWPLRRRVGGARRSRYAGRRRGLAAERSG